MRHLTAALCVLALGLAACGGGDEEEPASSTSQPEAAEPATLEITASGTSEDPAFELSATEVPAGVVDITMTYEGDKGELDGQLARVDGDHDVDEVIDQLKKAVSSKPIEDWFQAKGGVGAVSAGESGTVTQVLEPGTYYVLGGTGDQGGDPASFEVTGEASGDLPAADGGTIEASEYTFTGTAKAGKVKLELDNTGANWHHFIAFPMADGATIDDVTKFFKTEKGKPPVDFEAGFGSSVLDPGVSQVIDVDLKAGKYAFVCFLPDRQGGPPHFQRGMVSEIEVQ